MSKLTRDEILKIAKLAKISLTEEEVLKYQNQLSSVLEYVSQISEVETDDSLESSNKHNSPATPKHSDGGHNKNRSVKDIPGKCIKREKLLKNAPQQKNGFFVVPRVINK
jgi:aspartyl-tRNA(Asn)/glutamyl-tRNA(Gln) amidotransferase subunit C